MIGVAMLWLGTRVRDRDFEEQMATLNSEASSARERAGELEKRAAELNLYVMQITSWRNFQRENAKSAVIGLRRFAGTKFTMATVIGDLEAEGFLAQIETVLQMAGWEQVPWKYLPGRESLALRRIDKPLVGAVSAVGVVIQFHPAHAAEFKRAAEFFATVITDRGILGGLWAAEDPDPNPEALQISIGRKPIPLRPENVDMLPPGTTKP